MSTAADLGPGSKVSVHVVVDGDSLLSVLHEPGTPVGGYLQIASDGAYVALEVRDLSTAKSLRDRAAQLVDSLIDADLRRRIAMDDHPSAPRDVTRNAVRAVVRDRVAAANPHLRPVPDA